MNTYRDHIPTAFDAHIPLDDREDWLVAPVSQTRDSEALDRSNFAVQSQILDDVGAEYEIHRFWHWGPGWYEICIVHPAHKEAVQDLVARLDSYPALDEMALCELETEEAEEQWDFEGRHQIKRKIWNAVPETEDLPDVVVAVNPTDPTALGRFLVRMSGDRMFVHYLLLQDPTSVQVGGSVSMHNAIEVLP